MQSDWWTTPTESENGNLIMVTGRKDIDAFINNPKFNIRVEVTWKYIPCENGMPNVETSELMEQVHEALLLTSNKDPIAVLTGIYTGDGERNWIFYTRGTDIFGRNILLFCCKIWNLKLTKAESLIILLLLLKKQ